MTRPCMGVGRGGPDARGSGAVSRDAADAGVDDDRGLTFAERWLGDRSVPALRTADFHRPTALD